MNTEIFADCVDEPVPNVSKVFDAIECRTHQDQLDLDAAIKLLRGIIARQLDASVWTFFKDEVRQVTIGDIAILPLSKTEG